MGFIYNQIENLRDIAEDKDLNMYNTKLLNRVLSDAADTIETLYHKFKAIENKEVKNIANWNGEWKSPTKHPRDYEDVLICYEYTVVIGDKKRTERNYALGYVVMNEWYSDIWNWTNRKNYKTIAWMHLPEEPDKIISNGDEND
jgi:hypothetical protein